MTNSLKAVFLVFAMGIYGPGVGPGSTTETSSFHFPSAASASGSAAAAAAPRSNSGNTINGLTACQSSLQKPIILERLQPCRAVQSGDAVQVQRLLEAGADVNAIDKNGCTFLHLAAENGYTQVVQVLLKKGAKIDAADKTGYQALHYAALNGHIEAMELLLEKGAIIQDQSIQKLVDTNARVEVMACLLREALKCSQ